MPGICTNCKAVIAFGAIRDEDGVFCSEHCQRFYRHPGFCQACTDATLPRSAGDVTQTNGIGSAFFGGGDECTVCGSRVQSLWYTLYFIPVFPLGKFRVLYVGPKRILNSGARRFLSRRLAL